MGALREIGWKLLHNLPMLVIVALCGLLIASEYARQANRTEANNYRKLWVAERTAHRAVMEQRLIDLEEHVATLPDEGTTREYQERLTAVRARFDSVMRAPEKPATITCPQQPRPPAATPAPRATGASEVIVCSGEARDKLAKLQAWVREHMLAYHGVRV